jgi:hypothetical protein
MVELQKVNSQRTSQKSVDHTWFSLQVVSPDSALWLLEATINFTHAFPNEFYTEHEVEDLTLVIPKTADGMIDMAVLTQKYDEMKSDITTVYYGSSFTDKGLVLVDLEEDSQTETELILSVQTATGERGVDPGPVHLVSMALLRKVMIGGMGKLWEDVIHIPGKQMQRSSYSLL